MQDISINALGLVADWKGRPPPSGPLNVASILDRAAHRFSDKEALVGRYDRYTYKELVAAVNAAAAGLRDLGLSAGDRIAASGANHPDLMVAFLASQRLGAIWVGISRHLAAPEKAYLLQDSGASIFLGDKNALGDIEAHHAQIPELKTVLEWEPGAADGEWRRLIRSYARAPLTMEKIDPFAPAAIAYTSGTTGFPKGVVHSQHNMVVVGASAIAQKRGWYWQPKLKRGVTLPLTTLNLLVQGPLVAFMGAASCVCMDRSDALGVAEWCAAEQIQAFAAATTTVYDLSTRSDITPAMMASVECIVAGGADVSAELRDGYKAKFGKRIAVGYGQTEAPGSVAGTRIGHIHARESCGMPHDHVEIVILGEEDRACAIGEVGEIVVRARQDGPWADVYTPMLGYWRQPDATRKALAGRWLRTGDLGSFNDNGDLFVKGRRKEIIIRGGANIYPAEVERVLKMDPRVAEAAVLGKADPRLGEVVAAFVELVPPATGGDWLKEELAALCRRELAPYKVPVDWHFVAALPRNTTNKVSTAELRALLN